MVVKKSKKKIKVDKEDAKRRIDKILAVLKKKYPNAKTALEFRTPLQLLISTILSAQCTDARVNIVAKEIYKKYKNPADWAKADISQIENDIKSTGFYRNKAKNIKAACEKIISDYNGDVPHTMDELLKLPGVGRKTANCVLCNAYGQPAITCDTHVIRLSRRLGLSENTHDPDKLEFDLCEIVPRKDWSVFSHTIIMHGRNVCIARKPDCPNCEITEYCPAANKPELW
ncbi:MAG: endonuclease III [Phycisphaerae bacterium]|nr:endonuclease III [Phycisphaerae bacterium]